MSTEYPAPVYAFPGVHADELGYTPSKGMTLRDYFAANADRDELSDIKFRSLSRMAQEHVAGMKHPAEPRSGTGGYQSPDELVSYQLAVAEFEMRVWAWLRYRMADAMLEARK